MWNVSAAAIRNPIPIVLLFVILTLAGLLAYTRLGVNDNPDVDIPIVVVQVAQLGAAPAELETEVTRKVEDALVGVAGLDHITSTVSEGASVTIAEFKLGSDMETALNDVRDAVSKIRQQLPADVQEPAVTHPTMAGDPFITFTIASEKRSVAELSHLVDQEVTRALLSVPGVSKVDREGGLEREIRVLLDPARVRALGTSVEAVNLAIRGLNVNVPGGRADAAGQERSIRAIGSAPTVDVLRELPIPLGDGRYGKLASIAAIDDGHAEVRQRAYLDGESVVAFSAIRAQGAPLVQTEEALRAKVDALRKALPPDVKIAQIRSMADYTRISFKSTLEALVLGAVLAVVVIWLFLRDTRATLISALAIPLSVIATFAVMKYIGFTLNDLTMLGLTLVVGILVDDAIVDLENIYRHIGMGKTPMQAAFEATDEIGLAIVATTFTIIAVFMPVAFMSGIVGQFFRSFGLTVAIAVAFSLLVARTLTPMMAAHLLPPRIAHADEAMRGRASYLRLLTNAIRHRWITLGLAGLVFVGSLALVPIIPKGFITPYDIGQTLVAVSLPAGATLADTDRVVAETTRRIRRHPEVARVFAVVGGAAVNKAKLNVMLKPRHDRERSQQQLEDALRPEFATIPGARVEVQQFGATGSSKPVNLILRSTDTHALDLAASKLLAELRGVPTLREVTSTAAELRPEVQIRPRLQAAAEQGVTPAAIGLAARLATQGDADFNLAKFNAGDRQIDVRVMLDPKFRENLQAIADLPVRGRQGLVPLRSVADVGMGVGPVQIDRYDRSRQVTFSANLVTGAQLGDAMAQIQELPAIKGLPPGVTQGAVGETQVMIELFEQFLFALATAVLFIYAVLVLLFGSFLQPLTIMMALPLSIGGALVALLLAGQELGMMALIGIVMLMGLVTKNSILLVEYAVMRMGQGLPRFEALLAAGRDRVRPIMMTTVAMIAGMLPIALALGVGTAWLSPMAVAVIGGLITSTVFTLVVIPATFTVVDDVQGWVRRKVFKAEA
jgi:hydrophobe/amphiphile efflux-1 (HAE1) family protein